MARGSFWLRGSVVKSLNSGTGEEFLESRGGGGGSW